MEYFVVDAADNAFLITPKDLLVNGEAKGTMEAFRLGIGNRDIYERECHLCSNGFVTAIVGDQCDRLASRFRPPPANTVSISLSLRFEPEAWWLG